MPTPECFRVINYGGYYRDSAQGGSAVEYYAVTILTAAELQTAQVTLGLPKVGAFHIDPRLAFVGTVQDVDVVQEFGPAGFVARVRYSVGGTFNFGILLGMATGNDVETIYPPVLRRVPQVGTPFLGWVEVATRSIPRYCATIRITTRGGGGLTLGQINARVMENIGKVYVFDGVEYQLVGAPAVQDAGNNIRVETRFRHRGPVNDFPAGTYGDNEIDIPKLPPNADWHVAHDDPGAPIDVTDPLETQGVGAHLPWLL